MITLEQLHEAKDNYQEALKYYHSLRKKGASSKDREIAKAKYYELYNIWHKLYNRREYEMRKARLMRA
jgi:hypothetical protein